ETPPSTKGSSPQAERAGNPCTHKNGGSLFGDRGGSLFACQIQWDYVDLKLGVIFLPGQTNDEQAQFTGVKNNRDHLIPLSSYPWELLRDLHHQRITISPYVFPSVQCVHKPITDYGTYPKILSKMVGIDFGLHACRRTFASIADDVGLDYLKVKRSLNHSFEGGVTGGYINPGFNPERRRKHFQKICDYILRCKAIHNGEIRQKEEDFDQEAALAKLEQYIWDLGLEPTEALRKIVKRTQKAPGVAS
ncbi:tyrosine-type recombinase/integrase, partial [Acanthopleuribacter pedis]